MDAAKEAIDLCEENGYKLYGNSTNDLEQGKKNYHEAFVGDGISGSGFNWNEVLFALLNRELFPTVSRIWLLVLNLQVIRPKVLEGPYSRRGIV